MKYTFINNQHFYSLAAIPSFSFFSKLVAMHCGFVFSVKDVVSAYLRLQYKTMFSYRSNSDFEALNSY